MAYLSFVATLAALFVTSGGIELLTGMRNVALLALVAPAALLPPGWREVAMIGIVTASIVTTPRKVHESSGFTLAP